ncbi:hypothetical protein [Paenibacillus sp. FSL K6-1230]|uniref:hypothetical protein n=1 Tax=Paenibacillus sp. FSL K6-1230 TaxID=2921603 RepID=UPI0030FAE5CC
MASIIDYGSTYISTNTFPGILVRGSREIATTNVYINPQNPASYSARVELKASIGFYASHFLNKQPANIYILRFGIPIYSAAISLQPKPESQIATVIAIEGAVPGLQHYQLVVETFASSDTEVFVRGPIAFSATVIGI